MRSTIALYEALASAPDDQDRKHQRRSATLAVAPDARPSGRDCRLGEIIVNEALIIVPASTDRPMVRTADYRRVRCADRTTVAGTTINAVNGDVDGRKGGLIGERCAWRGAMNGLECRKILHLGLPRAGRK